MAHNRKTVLISISLLPQVLAGLDWLAKEEGRNRSAQISWLVSKALNGPTNKKLKKRAGLP